MSLQYESNQPHQIAAIESVCDLWAEHGTLTSISPAALDSDGLLFGQILYPNPSVASQEVLLARLRDIQRRNGLPQSLELLTRDFSVEMETGTGKTYVYLRTILELHKRHRLSKFVIVVPSVAIREGVLQAVEDMDEHFRLLYGLGKTRFRVYQSTRPAMLRDFATSPELEILVVNIDALNRADNIINRPQETLGGFRPADYLRAAAPVLILDEPQSIEGEISKQYLRALGPRFTLRYSATHRDAHNLLYRLSPVDAFAERLVKRVEVASVMERQWLGTAYVKLCAVSHSRGKLSVELELDLRRAGSIKRTRLRFSGTGQDLFVLSGGNPIYSGYTVDTVQVDPEQISFTNGVRLSAGEAAGADRDVIMREQVAETIRAHLDKEILLRRTLPAPRRMKVLSLFFIDRVANYAPLGSKIRAWFEEAYSREATRPEYAELNLPIATEVHAGYFAERRGVPRDSTGTAEADDRAFELIMKSKLKLLAATEPTRFIFSHSALREGWDNPNVFQICTLNDSKSPIRKRQEIGRGLRLPVDDLGVRCRNPSINILTVVVNESYRDFAAGLQAEIAEECNVDFAPYISSRRERRAIQLVEDWKANRWFSRAWSMVSRRTHFRVRAYTDELVRRAAAAIAHVPMPEERQIVTERARMTIDSHGVNGSVVLQRAHDLQPVLAEAIDVVGYIAAQARITRRSAAAILSGLSTPALWRRDPIRFAESASAMVRSIAEQLAVAHIEYVPSASCDFELKDFEQPWVTFEARFEPSTKSIYSGVECESEVEREYLRQLEVREDVVFYLKFPRWYQISTPVGHHTPDWLVVRCNRESGGFDVEVHETKGTSDQTELRGRESAKIDCARSHFNCLGVRYLVEAPR